ncbi:MAG TPA: nitrile hydratase subunit beta [Candidatus Acidoferrales bacterium]|jgi:nitrile hydratase|nr:nitrile hydratase subunit beta [Candidatus Acidoferrales bacterium]
MNGIHDLGGMQDMGPVQEGKNEPVFHHPWEARLFAITRSMSAWRKWNLDALRHQRELIPPAEYLRMSYYERWLDALLDLMVKGGLVTRAEIESGKPVAGSPKQTPALTADKVPALVAHGTPASRDAPVAPRFHTGQPVRARNINPVGHTRLPRYARGKLGSVERDHGVFVFPDTNALFLGEKPQHVYSVRFLARELWGDQAKPKDTVMIAMWDDYLEPA